MSRRKLVKSLGRSDHNCLPPPCFPLNGSLVPRGSLHGKLGHAGEQRAPTEPGGGREAGCPLSTDGGVHGQEDTLGDMR